MIFKINNKNKEKTTGISRDDKKAVLMVRPTFNKYESSQVYNYYNFSNYINFMVKGEKCVPVVLMVRHSPDKREYSQISGFDSQPGRTPFTFKLKT